MMKDVPQETRDLAISCAEKLLDCKQFVKDYKPERMPINDPSVTCILCRVEFTDESDEYASLNPPPELVVVSNATVSDLKLAASKAFQDVYLILKRFQAEELVDYGGVDESTQVKNLLGSAEYVRMRGRCNAKSGWNSDSVPANFVCQGCKSSVSVANTGGPCKDEVVANVAGDSCSFGNSLTAPPDIR
ncbi:hypothetical protein M0R45_005856 [Rubus argutus]|uniref:PHD finger protein MALE STERILITY 1-like ubiquitin-like domain-containing protein n=1 Tax=Rubus argutus TaxID=59490 RepID=A0AAW1YPB7_RUBAR